jgi:hypothetical protein
MTNTLQRLGFRQSSTKLRSRKENAYSSGHPDIKNSGAQSIHSPTSPKSLLLHEVENKSKASASSIVNDQKTSLPSSVSSSVGEDGRPGAHTAAIGYECVDSNIREHSIISDFTKSKGCLTAPESSHVKPIFVWKRKTGFIAQ